ncbi:pilus assembly protein PilM [Fusibacter sp. JL216-2]|uniref:pilus assembly protein PilM n=1 Tax=Fusibacter sp. JL216-2 TaxID=3071453 RepID=UPI003D33004D
MGKFIAMEIGNRMTKVIYGQDKKGDIHIKDYRLIENTDKIYDPDGRLNLNEIQPLLKEILKEMKVRRAECYLTVSGMSGVVRLREMPLVKIKEMKEIVRFEAEQFLPYNIEAFYLDFKVNQIKKSLSEESLDEGGEVAEVMIVAAPKDTVDEQVELVDKLKLNIKKVDYYTDAIFSYFRKHVLTEDKNTLVVDLGAKSMNLTMFNGTTYFANIQSELGIVDLIERHSEYTGSPLNKSREEMFDFEIKTKPKTSVSDVHTKLERLREKLQFSKLNQSHTNQIDSEIDPIYERIYEPIAYEVTKMMEFFKTRQFGMNVDEIYLIGGGTNLKQFDTFLKFYHNISVELVPNHYKNSDVKDTDYRLLIPVIGGLMQGGH